MPPLPSPRALGQDLSRGNSWGALPASTARAVILTGVHPLRQGPREAPPRWEEPEVYSSWRGVLSTSLEGVLVLFPHNIDYTAEKAERMEEKGVTEKEEAGPPGAGTRVPSASGEGREGWVWLTSAISALKERSPSDRAGGVALSRCSLEGLMLKLKLQYFGHLVQRVDSLVKTLMLRRIGGRRRRG